MSQRSRGLSKANQDHCRNIKHKILVVVLIFIDVDLDSLHHCNEDEDNMVNTALTFILLFLFTLLVTIGTTAIKVK